MGNKVFVSWSGGKDSYLALLKARESGLEISTLVTFLNKEGWSMSHGVKREVLEKQAAALGLPLEAEPVTWEDYQNGFLRVTRRIKQTGISGGVFGDINLPEHREWVEKMCGRVGMDAYLPLWGMDESEVVAELQRRGAHLFIVAIRSDLIEEKWLGREIDGEFGRMCERAGITPCGEKGEFHTLVVDGPLFQAPLQFVAGGINKRGQHAFLEIQGRFSS